MCLKYNNESIISIIKKCIKSTCSSKGNVWPTDTTKNQVWNYQRKKRTKIHNGINVRMVKYVIVWKPTRYNNRGCYSKNDVYSLLKYLKTDNYHDVSNHGSIIIWSRYLKNL